MWRSSGDGPIGEPPSIGGGLCSVGATDDRRDVERYTGERQASCRLPADRHGLTRRTVLGLTAGTAAAGTAGLAAGDGSDRVRVNVGYDRPSGERAAHRRADLVHHEFAFDVLTVETSRQAARELDRRDDVEFVEVDTELRAFAQQLPWGIDRVDAEVAHANGDTGTGADVSIIDTGIDALHADLSANLGEGKAFVGSTATGTGTPAWQDDNGHGTHCAGIADAVDNSDGVVGVSTEATLHAVKVLDDAGSGSFSDVAAGIEYVADQGWDVGSLSLGASSGSQTVKDACSYAYDNGVLLVAAAGNDGPCRDCVAYPAAYEECIAVSATDDDDDLVWYSSTGPEVELAAPGGDIYSTVIGGYDTYSGTSMACPHVAGTAGQLMSNGYNNSDTRTQLKDTAESIGLASNESGSGLLDAAAALGYDSSDST